MKNYILPESDIYRNFKITKMYRYDVDIEQNVNNMI